MANQTTNGKRLLDLINQEVKQINALNKRSEKLLKETEKHRAQVNKLIRKMSYQDLELYMEKLKKSGAMSIYENLI